MWLEHIKKLMVLEGLEFWAGLIFLVTLSTLGGRLGCFGDRLGVILGAKKSIENGVENLARENCEFCNLGEVPYRLYEISL